MVCESVDLGYVEQQKTEVQLKIIKLKQQLLKVSDELEIAQARFEVLHQASRDWNSTGQKA